MHRALHRLLTTGVTLLADSVSDKDLEIIALRHQLLLLRSQIDRAFQRRMYLTDHDHNHRYEPIYARFLPEGEPARASIVVAEMIHHALFGIEGSAVADDGADEIVLPGPSYGYSS